MVDLQKILDEELINAQIRKSEPGDEYEVMKGTYHVSGLTSVECLLRSLATRRIIMKDVEEGVTTGRDDMLRGQVQMLRDMKRGDVIHEFFTSICVKVGLEAGGIKRLRLVAKSKLLPERTFSMTGKYDLYDHDEDMIIEMKSVRQAAFDGWKGVPGVSVKPKDFHMEQANAYAFMKGAKNYKVVYIDSQGYRVAEHLGKLDMNLWEDMKHRADLMFYSESIGQVHPEILTMAVEEWKCKGCPISGECTVEQESIG